MADVSTQKTEGGKKDGGIRKEILIAIFIGFLSTMLFDPLTKLMWNWMLTMGRLGYTGLVNFVYRDAAYGHRNDVDLMFLEFIGLAGIMLVIGGGTGYLEQTKTFISPIAESVYENWFILGQGTDGLF